MTVPSFDNSTTSARPCSSRRRAFSSAVGALLGASVLLAPPSGVDGFTPIRGQDSRFSANGLPHRRSLSLDMVPTRAFNFLPSLFSTRLRYTNGVEDEVSRTHVDAMLLGREKKQSSPKWKIFDTPPQSELEGEQEKVDSYLVFLDKRYHRIHDEEPEENKGAFMKDLFSATISPQQRSNALFTLDVANLASERLLKKSRATRSSSAVFLAKTTTVGPVGSALAKLQKHLKRIDSMKSQLFKNMVEYMRKSLVYVLSVFKKAPVRSLLAVGKVSGGKTPAVLAISVLTAIFLFYPSLIAVARETSA
mmetsp:Transcript_20428/g.47275  ORF Transcript_20428/g.47275 Transcript_20428/m.47275 type:complete len:306 (+) Transcript_20428:89-1006(+)